LTLVSMIYLLLTAITCLFRDEFPMDGEVAVRLRTLRNFWPAAAGGKRRRHVPTTNGAKRRIAGIARRTGPEKTPVDG